MRGFQVYYPSEKTSNYIFKAMLNLVINNLAAADAHTGNIFSCPTLAIAEGKSALVLPVLL